MMPFRLRRRFEAAAFWLAILLAGSYPLLLITVNQGWVGLEAFLGVIGAHVLALVAGRDYHGERSVPG